MSWDCKYWEQGDGVELSRNMAIGRTNTKLAALMDAQFADAFTTVNHETLTVKFVIRDCYSRLDP